MDEKDARRILGFAIKDNNDLDSSERYIYWCPGDKTVTLDEEFSVEELEAIVWWIRNKNSSGSEIIK